MLSEHVRADGLFSHVVWQRVPRQRTSHRKGRHANELDWNGGVSRKHRLVERSRETIILNSNGRKQTADSLVDF